MINKLPGLKHQLEHGSSPRKYMGRGNYSSTHLAQPSNWLIITSNKILFFKSKSSDFYFFVSNLFLGQHHLIAGNHSAVSEISSCFAQYMPEYFSKAEVRISMINITFDYCRWARLLSRLKNVLSRQIWTHLWFRADPSTHLSQWQAAPGVASEEEHSIPPIICTAKAVCPRGACGFRRAFPNKFPAAERMVPKS